MQKLHQRRLEISKVTAVSSRDALIIVLYSYVMLD